MKKILMAITVPLFVASCATTTATKELHPTLTMDNVQEKCKPDEFWNVQVLSTPAAVIKFTKCMKYDNLFLVSVPNTVDTKKIRALVSELLVEQYLSYLERTNDNTRWSAKNIKTAVENEWRNRYFLLDSKPKSVE